MSKKRKLIKREETISKLATLQSRKAFRDVYKEIDNLEEKVENGVGGIASIQTSNTGNVKFTGDGTAENPLKAEANVEVNIASITTTQTAEQLNALADGLYFANGAGVYNISISNPTTGVTVANGKTTVESGYSVSFNKKGNVWSLASVVAVTDPVLTEKVAMLVEDSKNIYNTLGKLRAGSYSSTGSFSASNNWLSLQPILIADLGLNLGDSFFLRGLGGVQTTSIRIIIQDINNTILFSENGLGTSVTGNSNNKVYTLPANAYKILINITQGTNVGLNLQNSAYHNTFMLGKGNVILPYEKFGFVPVSKSNICYISPSGLDTNNGLTEETPVLTMSRAKEILSDYGILYLLNGDYYDYNLDLSLFKNIKTKQGGKVRFIYGTRFTSATLVSGKTKTQSVSYTHSGTWLSNFNIWQHDIADPRSEITMSKRHPVHNGLIYRLSSYQLKWVDSIDEVESSPVPCYYYDSVAKVLYFQKVDGSDLTVNPIVVPSVNSLSNTSEQIGHWSNINILYRSWNTSKLQGNVYNLTVLFVNNTVGAITTNNTTNLNLINCRAGGASNDGFNGHVTDTTDIYNNYLNIKLIDCWAHDCYDDAESHHNYCSVVVNGGLYEYCGSGCTPAQGAHAVYNNVTVQNCTVTGFQAQGASGDGGISTNIHCYGCIADSNGKNFEGRGQDSRFVNCISITPSVSHFSGIDFRKFNCIEIN